MEGDKATTCIKKLTSSHNIEKAQTLYTTNNTYHNNTINQIIWNNKEVDAHKYIYALTYINMCTQA
jgi:hypothetical protein